MEKFAAGVGLSLTAISLLESGTNNPSNQTILSICREFGINEEWLRTGEGDMKADITREEQIAALMNRLLSDEQKSFRLTLINYVSKMSSEQLDLLRDMIHQLVQEDTEDQ